MNFLTRPATRRLCHALVGFAATWSTATNAATAVGETEFARGAAAAQLAGQPPRILGKGAEVYREDVVQTGARSFAILRFQDSAKVTVRPNSKLTIDEYLAESGEISLHAGGIRATSGAIAKTKPGGFTVNTPVARLEVNDASFDARICDRDCEAEEGSRAAPEKPELDSVVGRVALLRGSMTAESEAYGIRKLRLGAPLHEKDTLKTGAGSHALLVFRDGSRVTLQADTEYQILAQKYYPDAPEKNESAAKFVRGGMRALTGAIGKESPDQVRVSTPVATTGIRGTGWDHVCQGACINDGFSANAIRAGDPLPNGLYTLVWEGKIYMQTEAGTFELDTNQAGYIPNSGSILIRLPLVPGILGNNPYPRPDSLRIDMNQLFGNQSLEGSPPGLYVYVRSGHVRLIGADGKVLDLGTGEIGYVDPTGTVLIRVRFPRAFLSSDVYPPPDITRINEDLFTLLDEDADMLRQEFFECICPL